MDKQVKTPAEKLRTLGARAGMANLQLLNHPPDPPQYLLHDILIPMNLLQDILINLLQEHLIPEILLLDMTSMTVIIKVLLHMMCMGRREGCQRLGKSFIFYCLAC